MRFASLGSGSEGNAWLVQPFVDGAYLDQFLMIDCGFTIKETVARLERLNIQPSQLCGIVTTHEHDDHLGGVFKFSRRFGTPVYLTHGTWRAALKKKNTIPEYLETGRVHLIDSACLFECGPFQVEPFPVPHDAREPIQLLIHGELGTLGLLTDCGSSTPHLVAQLKKADWLILESNHCRKKLWASGYPESLKRRVGGPYGHLSNETACYILNQVGGERLSYVVAAHLSQNTNCPVLVREMWEGVLSSQGIKFDIACQAEGVPWFCAAEFKQSREPVV